VQQVVTRCVSGLQETWGGVGVMGALEHMAPDRLAAYAQEVERLGYRAVWVGENVGREPFAALAHTAAVTTTLRLGTGIAAIWARTPATTRAGALTVQELSGGRFALGLGVSDKAFSQQVWNAPYERPVEQMRAFLDAYEAAPIEVEAPEPPPLLLAALRPRMLELAAERADGVYPYLVTTGAVARTREAIGPDKLVVASLPVALGDGARERARTYVGVYRDVRTYRENLGALGFGDDDFDPAPTDRLVDALVASGDVASIRARIDELHEAGADQVVLMTLDGDPWYEPSLDTLRALAAGQPQRQISSSR
jgi:probable F420-dependent oxidoreductase